MTLRTCWVLVGILTGGFGVAPAGAEPERQLFKLLARDGIAFDLFGKSAAVSGSIAVVGAPDDDNINGELSGSAYVFDVTTGQQLFKLLPDDGAPLDGFGHSVAVNGTTAVIGMPYDGSNGVQSGSAYVFDVTTGKQLFKLLPNDGAFVDLFGYFVAVSGTTAVVGARGDDDNGGDSGSAYVFDVTTGQQLFKLLPDDGASLDWFGASVAVDGKIAVVGAFRSSGNEFRSGAAYVFDVATGRQVFKLIAGDGERDDVFGNSVAVCGTIAVIGADGDGDNNYQAGSAYVFDVTTGQELFKLLPDDGAAFDHFGRKVALSGTTAVVGALFDDDNGNRSGSAYVFDVTTGMQLAKLLPRDGADDDRFGVSVAVNGTIAVVGALAGTGNHELLGSAYVFDVSRAADLNGDGCVNGVDLGGLLGAWGTADLNNDGLTNAADLALLLGSWETGCS